MTFMSLTMFILLINSMAHTFLIVVVDRINIILATHILHSIESDKGYPHYDQIYCQYNAVVRTTYTEV